MLTEFKSISEIENKFVKYEAIINSSNYFIDFKIIELFLLKYSESNFNVTDFYYEKSSNSNKRSLTKKKSNSFYLLITSFIQLIKKFQQRSSKLSNTNIFISYQLT